MVLKSNNWTIICVDDDPAMLESYGQVLRPENDIFASIPEDEGGISPERSTDAKPAYNLLLASSGEEAVQIVREQLRVGNRIAAGFFDVGMPGGVNGHETLKIIHQLDPEIYCAVVTSYTDREVNQIRNLFNAAYQDHFIYFKKPFSVIELEQTALNLVTAWNRKSNEAAAYQSLQEVKNDWQDVFDTISDAITIHDLDHNIIRSNRAAETMFGVSCEKGVGQKCFSWMHGTDGPPVYCPSCSTIATKSPVVEQFFEARLGKHLEVRTLPRLDQAGELYGIIHIIRDITEKVNSERAFGESEKRFRDLAEMVPVAVFEMDLSGLITYANRSAFDSFGFTRQDLEDGVSSFDLISKKERSKARERVETLIKGGQQAISHEYSACRKDGTHFQAIFRSAPIILEGRLCGVRGAVVDISEKTNLEDKLYQAEKLEAVGTLAGGIAHDFNNILSAVIGYADLGKMVAKPEDSVAEYFNEISNAGQRATKLIKQILAFSRKDEQDFFPVQVKSIIKEALKLLRATIPTTIEIKQDIDPQCDDIVIMADQTQIHRVVMNLCTNAYHAMRESGGVLEVRLTKTELLADDIRVRELSLSPGAYLTISVKDQGPGMDKGVVARIFEPYFTTKKQGEGTGLGLAVTLRVIQKHSGAISVDSEPGKGTTFQVFLPITKSVSSEGESESVLHVPGGDEHILFVDDEAAIVTLNQMALGTLGYEVTSTTNSEEAFELFEQNPQSFDLIITDMSMPKMSGADLVKGTKEIRPDIAIIMCTGFSEIMDRERALSLGVDEYIMKPVTITELAQSIRKVLQNE